MLIDKSYYFSHKDTKTHIKIKGDNEKPIILYLHGGPGGDCAPFIYHYGELIEQDYLMVYWDQRGSGLSDKYLDEQNISFDLFISDLHDIIIHLKENYKTSHLILLGTSWGASLGLMYLTKYQGIVDALICIGGLASVSLAMEGLISYEKKFIKSQLIDEKNSIRKKELQKLLQNINLVDSSYSNWDWEAMQMVKHLIPEKLKINVFQIDSSIEYIPDDVYKSLGYDLQSNNGRKINKHFWEREEFKNMNFLTLLSKISDPVNIIQGEFDLIAGIKQAKTIYNNLSLHSDKKELTIIPKEGHRILKKKTELIQTINSFISKQLLLT